MEYKIYWQRVPCNVRTIFGSSNSLTNSDVFMNDEEIEYSEKVCKIFTEKLSNNFNLSSMDLILFELHGLSPKTFEFILEVTIHKFKDINLEISVDVDNFDDNYDIVIESIKNKISEVKERIIKEEDIGYIKTYHTVFVSGHKSISRSHIDPLVIEESDVGGILSGDLKTMADITRSNLDCVSSIDHLIALNLESSDDESYRHQLFMEDLSAYMSNERVVSFSIMEYDNINRNKQRYNRSDEYPEYHGRRLIDIKKILDKYLYSPYSHTFNNVPDHEGLKNHLNSIKRIKPTVGHVDIPKFKKPNTKMKLVDKSSTPMDRYDGKPFNPIIK